MCLERRAGLVVLAGRLGEEVAGVVPQGGSRCRPGGVDWHPALFSAPLNWLSINGSARAMPVPFRNFRRLRCDQFFSLSLTHWGSVIVIGSNEHADLVHAILDIKRNVKHAAVRAQRHHIRIVDSSSKDIMEIRL